jgi:hypothetical protein
LHEHNKMENQNDKTVSASLFIANILVFLSIIAAMSCLKFLFFIKDQSINRGDSLGLGFALMISPVIFIVLTGLLVYSSILINLSKSAGRFICIIALAMNLFSISLFINGLYIIASSGRSRQELKVTTNEASVSKLIRAILDNNVDSARERILKNKQLIIERDNTGHPLLHLAVDSGHIPMVEMLLQNGANPSGIDYDHVTALHLAAKSNRIEIAEILLNNKAGVNARDHDGNTPLAYAKKAGNKKMANLLIKYGAKDVDEDSQVKDASIKKDILQKQSP